MLIRRILKVAEMMQIFYRIVLSQARVSEYSAVYSDVYWRIILLSDCLVLPTSVNC
jgi:hypothetical protein